jgi:hypothetical protein
MLFLFVFSGRLISGVMNYLHIERHLAAKFGTNFGNCVELLLGVLVLSFRVRAFL